MKELIINNKINAAISLFLLVVVFIFIWLAITRKHNIQDPQTGDNYKKTNMMYVYAAAATGSLFLLSVMSLTGSNKSLEEALLTDVL